MRTCPPDGQIVIQLLLDNRLLELAEDGLGVPEGKSDVLHVVTSAFDCVKWHGDWARPGCLEANLNSDSHGAHLSGDGVAKAASLRLTARRSKRSG